MKKIVITLFMLTAVLTQAQKKKLWAASFLDKEAPELVVEEWISEQPDVEGKFVLIDFWATWCGPCKRAIPDMNEFQKEFKDDLVVIGISDESKEKVLKQRSPSIEYFNAIDTQKRMKKVLKVRGIPHCILINPDGIVVWEGFPLLQGNLLTKKVIGKLIADYKKQK